MQWLCSDLKTSSSGESSCSARHLPTTALHADSLPPHNVSICCLAPITSRADVAEPSEPLGLRTILQTWLRPDLCRIQASQDLGLHRDSVWRAAAANTAPSKQSC